MFFIVKDGKLFMLAYGVAAVLIHFAARLVSEFVFMI